MADVLVTEEGVILVVIRGTATQREWSNDFRFPTRALEIAGSNLLVHDGFADMFESLAADLHERVSEARASVGDTASVVVTGHSLGAAVATLATLYLAYDHADVSGIVFGSPRVGDPAFAVKFGAYVGPFFQRYEIKEDPVINLPCERVLFWKYRHVGEPITLLADLGSDRENHVIGSYRRLIEERS